MEPIGEWRLSTSAGIPYKLVSRSGDFSYEGANAQEEYILQASDLFAFVTNAFPEPLVFMGTLRYPQQPGLLGLITLVPKKISWQEHVPGVPIDPFGSDPNAPDGTYQEFIKVIVDYGPTPPNDEEQDPNNPRTFLDISANASGVFLNSPQEGQAEWELPDWAAECNKDAEDNIVSGECADVVTPNIPRTVTETQVEWTVRWPSIPYSFWDGTLISRMRASLGKVNSSAMPIFHNAPAETILFMSYSKSVQYTWRSGKTGASPIMLEMHFIEKNFTDTETTTTPDPDDPLADPTETENTVAVNHQHMWRPNFGWRKLKINGDYIYKTTDLNDIWSPR
jgi:hypothetical protein